MAKCPLLHAAARVPVGRFLGVGPNWGGYDRAEQDYNLFDPGSDTECLGQGCQWWSTWYVVRETEDGDDTVFEEIQCTGCGLLADRAIPHNQ